jgi:hypothetical protein
MSYALYSARSWFAIRFPVVFLSTPSICFWNGVKWGNSSAYIFGNVLELGNGNT